MLVYLDSRGKVNWASGKRTLLFEYGFGHVWLSQTTGNFNYVLNELKVRAIGMFKQEWHGNVEESSRFDFYLHVQFKSRCTYLV